MNILNVTVKYESENDGEIRKTIKKSDEIVENCRKIWLSDLKDLERSDKCKS